MDNSNSLTFTVEGHPIPCVRTTQKQKWLCPKYKRYEEYKSRIRSNILGVMLKDRISIVTEPVKITVGIFVKGGRRGDIDNYLKSILDGIQPGNKLPGFIANDKQVNRAVVDIFPVDTPEEEKIEVTLKW